MKKINKLSFNSTRNTWKKTINLPSLESRLNLLEILVVYKNVFLYSEDILFSFQSKLKKIKILIIIKFNI